MKILISGASGLVGRALESSLKASGDDVFCLVRDRSKVSDRAIFWDPNNGLVDIASLEGFDAVVHLAGENIAAGRWTDEQKKHILNSRLQGTKTLVNALTRLKQPPKVFVSASAVGYYGDRGDEICTEESSSGTGFLADVCRQWEAAAKPAEEIGIRTVFLRTGIVLSPNGGALAKMLPPFKLGLGGKLGSGQQYMSWIALDDLVGAIIFAIENDRVSGPINGVAPHAVTNAEFTTTLGTVLNRPTIFPVPAFVLKLLLGEEMANEVLLGGAHVEPKQLESLGYSFKYPELEPALKNLLGSEGANMVTQEGAKSEKSFIATLLFALILGTLGVHRFYVGKIGTGILMLITLGGFGIWTIVDLIMIVAMRFRDKQGLLIEP